MITDIEFLIQRFSAASVSLGDIEMLAHFAKDLDIVVELGTNIGTTSILLSAVAKKVVTTDVFENVEKIEDDVQRGIYAQTFGNNNHYYKQIKQKLKPFNVEVFQCLSYQLAEAFLPDSIDMVFIDADHSYKGVEKDYCAWFDRVKIGGYFAFHDCVEPFDVYEFKKNVLDNDKRISIVSDAIKIDNPSLTSVVVYEKKVC
jgi:predicted O-methyltransferase YrrM